MCQGFLSTIRHFENRWGKGPGDEVDRWLEVFGNLRTFSENVRKRWSRLQNNFGKSSEIFGKSSKTPSSVCFIIKRTLHARRYEFYVLVARTISHDWAILFLPFEHKIHIFSPRSDDTFILFKVPITPKPFFFVQINLCTSLKRCEPFCPFFNSNIDLLQAVKITKSGHHLSHDRASKGYGSIPCLTSQTPLHVCLQRLRGKKLNYKSVAKEISKPSFLAPEVMWASKFACLFDSRFL